MTTEKTLLTITSVRSATVQAGNMVIDTRWKSTDKRSISPANSYRAVEVPATIWSATTSLHDSKEMQLFLHDGIMDLAKSYLSTIVEDSNWQRTQVPQDDFLLSTLLAWNAARAEASGRLSGDAIKEWLTTSVTIARIREVHGDKIADGTATNLVKLASPNHGLTPERAKTFLAGAWRVEDCETSMGLRIQLRLEAIANKVETANVLPSIL